MNDYNRRQIKNINEHILAYEKGITDLGGLILGIEALLNALDGMPEAWLDKVRNQWGILEEVYSVELMQGLPIEVPENRLLVNRAIVEIKRLLDAGLLE